MADGGAQAVLGLYVVESVNDPGNKGQNDHQAAFQQTLAPVIEMPKAKSDIGHDQGYRPVPPFPQPVEEKTYENENLDDPFVDNLHIFQQAAPKRRRNRLGYCAGSCDDLLCEGLNDQEKIAHYNRRVYDGKYECPEHVSCNSLETEIEAFGKGFFFVKSHE